MRGPMDWVPMEWPASWPEAAGFELLRGTPVNCLLAPEAIKAAATRAGFATPAVNWQALEKTDWSRTGEVVGLAKCPWPGVQASTTGSGAGPTGNPWVDSNGWQIRLARVKAPGKPVWVSYEATEAPNYPLAIADAACCGGRWAVKLDPEMAAGLAKGNAQAHLNWKELTAALGFFERHGGWGREEASAKLAVVSAFADTNSGEILNLATRQHLAYRVVEKGQVTDTSFAGLECVLYADDDPPAKPVLAKMMAFAQAGGLLMVPRPTAALIPGVSAAVETQIRSSVHKFGKGRIAMPLKEWDDPYLLASDAHLLLSHRYDPVRLFNSGLLVPYVTNDAARKRFTVQMVNFAGRESANFVSMGIQTPCRRARLWALETGEPSSLEIHRESGRPELHLPPFKNYAAVELEA